jgi:hypothetical protein
MKFKTTKQNTYNHIPRKAIDNVFKRAYDNLLNSTFAFGSIYYEERYNDKIEYYLLNMVMGRSGEQAPPIQ